ncbi:Spi family protease inhibitor, partial [uncultured Alistipes sp.]
MKRFSLFAIAAWFATWLVSCSSPEQVAPAESPEMPEVPVAYVTVPDRSEEVSEAAVRSVAALFGADEATRAGEREIESVHTLRSQSGDALCYVVNYRGDRGFVVVSATKDYMPVLAFSDEGRFDVESIDKTGVSVWLAEQQA